LEEHNLCKNYVDKQQENRGSEINYGNIDKKEMAVLSLKHEENISYV
jgi:hypothetical protein